jgi:hypothetical protein
MGIDFLSNAPFPLVDKNSIPALPGKPKRAHGK